MSFWSNFLSTLFVTVIVALFVYLFTDLFKRSVTVLVHEAYAGNSNQKNYFVKITNISSSKIFTITHVYIKDIKKEIDLLNVERPLPHKISPSEQWETWIPESRINDNIGIFNNVRAVMSNGKIITSSQNKKVRPAGFVA